MQGNFVYIRIRDACATFPVGVFNVKLGRQIWICQF